MRKLRITIGNKSYEVTVEDLTEAGSYQTPTPPAQARPTPQESAPPAQSSEPTQPKSPVDKGAVTSPMAGVIKSVLVNAEESVHQGQALIVLEAMKMENRITAPIAGTVKKVEVEAGASVQEGDVLLVLE